MSVVDYGNLISSARFLLENTYLSARYICITRPLIDLSHVQEEKKKIKTGKVTLLAPGSRVKEKVRE